MLIIYDTGKYNISFLSIYTIIVIKNFKVVTIKALVNHVLIILQVGALKKFVLPVLVVKAL